MTTNVLLLPYVIQNDEQLFVQYILKQQKLFQLFQHELSLELFKICIINNNSVILEQLFTIIDQTNFQENLLLHLAVEHESLECVKILLNNNFSLYSENELKQIPLHIAALYGDRDIFNYLSQYDENQLNIVDVFNFQPIQYLEMTQLNRQQTQLNDQQITNQQQHLDISQIQEGENQKYVHKITFIEQQNSSLLTSSNASQENEKTNSIQIIGDIITEINDEAKLQKYLKQLKQTDNPDVLKIALQLQKFKQNVFDFCINQSNIQQQFQQKQIQSYQLNNKSLQQRLSIANKSLNYLQQYQLMFLMKNSQIQKQKNNSTKLIKILQYVKLYLNQHNQWLQEKKHKLTRKNKQENNISHISDECKLEFLDMENSQEETHLQMQSSSLVQNHHEINVIPEGSHIKQLDNKFLQLLNIQENKIDDEQQNGLHPTFIVDENTEQQFQNIQDAVEFKINEIKNTFDSKQEIIQQQQAAIDQYQAQIQQLQEQINNQKKTAILPDDINFEHLPYKFDLCKQYSDPASYQLANTYQKNRDNIVQNEGKNDEQKQQIQQQNTSNNIQSISNIKLDQYQTQKSNKNPNGQSKINVNCDFEINPDYQSISTPRILKNTNDNQQQNPISTLNQKISHSNIKQYLKQPQSFENSHKPKKHSGLRVSNSSTWSSGFFKFSQQILKNIQYNSSQLLYYKLLIISAIIVTLLLGLFSKI